jgi:acetylornithine deacetylase/succinyl-diaminopimelate desuccinylase-like protein
MRSDIETCWIPRKIEQVDAYFRKNEPRHASMLRTSASPNMVVAGYRINVIPSEAIATLDVRALPDEDMTAFLDKVRKVVDDPNVEVRFGKRDTRPGGTEARIDSELFKSWSRRPAPVTTRPRCPR